MLKVDRLGWVVGFSLRSYGVKIGFRCNDPAVLARVIDLLPGEWERAEFDVVDRLYSVFVGGAGRRANVRNFNLVYADHVRIGRSLELDTLLATLDSDLRIFVAEFAKGRVFVHAGVVGWKGRAIVIPGRSFSGKSTLVAALINAGATYYSDEYAVFDGRGRVHPFSKPLELRDDHHRQRKIELGAFGATAGTQPLRVGLVLVTRFRDGARWRPRRISSGNAVLHLLGNTVSARRNPRKALETLERVTAAADVLKGVRGNANDIVPDVLKRLERL